MPGAPWRRRSNCGRVGQSRIGGCWSEPGNRLSNKRRDSHPPQNIRLLLLRLAQHIQEREGALRQPNRHLVFVVMTVRAMMQIVLGIVLPIQRHRGFEFGNHGG